jgi:hypothetical protein
VTAAATTDAPGSYPPPPWHLGGSMDVSLWRVPVHALPASVAAALPRDAGPVRVGVHALVGTAFVRYEPGGALSYDELLAATLVRQGPRPRVTIGDIWVDSPASRAGGRELWGIPKQLASFERRDLGTVTEARAALAGDVLAEVRVAPRGRLPGWRSLPLATTQRLDGVETVAGIRALARVRRTRAAWRFPPGSPLAWLRGTPLVSVRLEDLTIRFGDG